MPHEKSIMLYDNDSIALILTTHQIDWFSSVELDMCRLWYSKMQLEILDYNCILSSRPGAPFTNTD